MMLKKEKELKPKTSLSYADNQAPKIISLWSAARAGKVSRLEVWRQFEIL